MIIDAYLIALLENILAKKLNNVNYVDITVQFALQIKHALLAKIILVFLILHVLENAL